MNDYIADMIQRINGQIGDIEEALSILLAPQMDDQTDVNDKGGAGSGGARAGAGRKPGSGGNLSPKNGGSINGRRFWSGSVSLLDGKIEETHTYEEAEDRDFHHSMYFTPQAQERMSADESAFFTVDENGKISGWSTEIPPKIIAEIQRQLD